MQLFILCFYFFILPYRFPALISPSSGVSQAVFLYTTIWFIRYEQPKISTMCAKRLGHINVHSSPSATCRYCCACLENIAHFPLLLSSSSPIRSHRLYDSCHTRLQSAESQPFLLQTLMLSKYAPVSKTHLYFSLFPSMDSYCCFQVCLLYK